MSAMAELDAELQDLAEDRVTITLPRVAADRLADWLAYLGSDLELDLDAGGRDLADALLGVVCEALL